jgi:hypothetical protein
MEKTQRERMHKVGYFLLVLAMEYQTLIKS